jgi:hypothetical protein
MRLFTCWLLGRYLGQLSWLTTINGEEIVSNADIAVGWISGKKSPHIRRTGAQSPVKGVKPLSFPPSTRKLFQRATLRVRLMTYIFLGASKWPQPLTPTSIR